MDGRGEDDVFVFPTIAWGAVAVAVVDAIVIDARTAGGFVAVVVIVIVIVIVIIDAGTGAC